MSGYANPYEGQSTSYVGHNYHDSGEYNPYGPPTTVLNRGNTFHSNNTAVTGSTASEYPNDSPDSSPPRPPRKNEQPVPFLSNMNKLSKPATRDSFTPLTRSSGTPTNNIKRWRKDAHGGLWTRGSKVGCVGRFCCCFFLIFILLLVSIVLALVMWVRPPQVLFNGVQTKQDGSTFEATTNNEFKINLGFNIFVSNPNYFAATFSTISADIFYPLNGASTNVGGGTEKDITFHSHSSTNFTFPFSFVYDKTADPNQAVLKDLMTKCGIPDASTKANINIDYKINIRLRVLVASVGPSFSGTANFACPVDAAQLEPFIAGLIPGGITRSIDEN